LSFLAISLIAAVASSIWHLAGENRLPMRLPADFYRIESKARPVVLIGAVV
jgi:hypothetical protein